jgi:hypothetical protein
MSKQPNHLFVNNNSQCGQIFKCVIYTIKPQVNQAKWILLLIYLGSVPAIQANTEITACSNPSFGGTIGTIQSICYNTVPNTLANIAYPSGYDGVLEYKWQFSTTGASAGFSDIDSSNSVDYTPDSLVLTTWFKRLVRVDCEVGWTGAAESNIVAITVYPEFVVGSISANQSIAINSIPQPLTGTPPTGGRTPYTYQWQRSSDNITWVNVFGGTNLNYSPGALAQTRYYRQLQTSGGPSGIAPPEGITNIGVGGNCGVLITDPISITVQAVTGVTFEGTFDDLKLCADPIILTGGMPAGGTYSGNGVSSGLFDPAMAGPGTWTITYSYTDILGITDSATNSIAVMQPETFSYFIGVNGDFLNLTGDEGLFSFLNANRRCGDVFVYILNDLNENGSQSLDQADEANPGGFNLTIFPIDESQKLISGNSNQALIRLNGVDHITIDGGIFWPYRALKFRNTNSSNPTMLISGGVNFANITGCEFEGNNTNVNSAVVVLESVGGDNGNIEFYRCNFGNVFQSNTAPANLFMAKGPGINSHISFNTNEFRNYSSNGLFVSASGNGGNWYLYNNSFYATLVLSSSQTAINFIPGSSSLNNIISANYVGGSTYQTYGSNFVNAGAVSFKGISVNSGDASISGNTIGNIKLSNSGTASFTGIEVLGGTALVDGGNIIGSTYIVYSITIAGTGAFYGIRSAGAQHAVTIKDNTVANISFSANLGSPKAYCFWMKYGRVEQNRAFNIGSQSAMMTLWVYGIYNEANVSANTISNNMIALKGGNSLNPRLFGIYDKSTVPFSQILHNTVSIQGAVYAAASNISAAFYREGTSSVCLYNNILHNAKSSTVYAKQYAIYSSTSAAISTNYNDLIAASQNLVYWGGTIFSNLSLWKSASRDYNSISVVPVYLSATDLHLTCVNAGIDNRGSGSNSLNGDFDGCSRCAINPDMGCDEFVSTPGFIEPETIVDQAAEPGLTVFPNPIQAAAIMTVTLGEESEVRIEIYNMLGKAVQCINDQHLPQGTTSIEWKSGNLPAGEYLFRMLVNNEKMVVKRVEIIR